MPDEPTKADLEQRAEELGVPKTGTKNELAERVALAEASDPDTSPPTTDRPALVDVAQERAANVPHLRVIGADVPEEA